MPNSKNVLVKAGWISLVIGLPFAGLHLLASPDDARISPLQHISAALANYLGPWGIALVRLVDFPNAGMRSFSWSIALGMTVMAALLLLILALVRNRWGRVSFLVIWGLFMVAWFGIGLFQIADGLL